MPDEMDYGDDRVIGVKDKQIYEAARVTFGESNQLTVATEELAELQQQICKVQRGKLVRKDLIEEIADALNGIEQVMQMLNITDGEMKQVKRRKLRRLIKRIGEARGLSEGAVLDWIRNLGNT